MQLILMLLIVAVNMEMKDAQLGLEGTPVCLSVSSKNANKDTGLFYLKSTHPCWKLYYKLCIIYIGGVLILNRPTIVEIYRWQIPSHTVQLQWTISSGTARTDHFGECRLPTFFFPFFPPFFFLLRAWPTPSWNFLSENSSTTCMHMRYASIQLHHVLYKR